MLGRVERGEITGIVVWHTDRMLRQPRDLEKLIDLGSRGLRVASCYGDHDLANSDDRFMLRVLTASACKSSDDTSRRMKRRMETLRNKGFAHPGARRFGFPGKDRTLPKPAPGEPDTRPDVSEELVAREREALRQAAEQIVSGVSLARISRAWNDAGLRTSTGRKWTSVTVRAVLLRARNAGLIEHNGALVDTGDAAEADDPIIDEELFARVRSVFAYRRRGRAPGERYLGSGIVRCALCGKTVSGKPHVGTYRDGEPRRQYHCPRNGGCGKVAADARRVDERLREITLRRLSDHRHAAAISAAHARAAERLAELDRDLSGARASLLRLGDKFGRSRGTMSFEAYEAASAPLERWIAEVAAERDTLLGEAPSRPLSAVDRALLAQRWDDGDVAERRAMLAQALTGTRGLVLDPAGGRRVFDPLRVRLAEPDDPSM